MKKNDWQSSNQTKIWLYISPKVCKQSVLSMGGHHIKLTNYNWRDKASPPPPPSPLKKKKEKENRDRDEWRKRWGLTWWQSQGNNPSLDKAKEKVRQGFPHFNFLSFNHASSSVGFVVLI